MHCNENAAAYLQCQTLMHLTDVVHCGRLDQLSVCPDDTLHALFQFSANAS